MQVRILAALIALVLLLGAALAEPAGVIDTSGIAAASDMTDVIDIVDPGMVPVTAAQLVDGVYPVAVDASSSMFKISRCELTVEGGAMTAKLVMNSEAYSFMYPGPAEEAARAAFDALAALETDEDGSRCFILPVDALDAGYTCAAFSARKQLWYPRTLVFRADSLPAEAWRADAFATAGSLGLSDGSYTCEVVLEGAGRATLESPAHLTVEDGACTAEIVFSTAKIGYVIVDGEVYEPTSTEGGAAFTVPVAAFDRKLPITVNSTAIKPATDVAYAMTFDSATLAG